MTKPLTFISALAGFDKTTPINEWWANAGWDVMWYPAFKACEREVLEKEVVPAAAPATAPSAAAT